MIWTTVAVGAEGALVSGLLAARSRAELARADVVLVPTAAAFTGATEASVRVAAELEALDARIEALMVTTRDSANEAYFADRVAAADIVVLLDGSALHARSTWRDTAISDALARSSLIVAIGSVATLLGEEMIDPRGGAPTPGLAIRSGAVLTASASESQLERTRSLTDPSRLLIVLDGDGAVAEAHGQWHQLTPAGVTASRGATIVALPRLA